MNGTPTLDDRHDLDDFERDIVHALRVKADQLVVDDGPFDAEARPGAPRLVPSSSGPAGPSLRRVLALAAAVAVLGGAVVVAQRLGPAGTGGTRGPEAVAAAGTYTVPDSGPAALLPATVPEGWTLREVNAGRTYTEPAETTWQLFGVDAPSPLPRGVLVSSAVNAESLSGRIIDGQEHDVGEEPLIGPAQEPLAPAGTLEATWLDGDVLHRALAVGVPEDELATFLASLVPHDDPATGFGAPADLPLLETTSVADRYTASATYAGPAGEADTIRVTASAPGDYGGLLHRLVGEPGDEGPALRGDTGGDPAYPFVSRARPDGWTVEVLGVASPTVAADPAVLDAFLDALAPLSREQLVDVVAAEPVTTTGTAGGWSVEVHGTGVGAVGLCLAADAGERACTTAETSALPGLSTGSALVGDQWVVAAVHDDAIAPTVSAVRGGAQGPPYPQEDRLRAERGRSDDDRAVEVFAVPPDVDTVAVTVSTGPDGGATGVLYDRPPA